MSPECVSPSFRASPHRRQGSIVVFDAAYAPFIRTPGVPQSIFEIEGARSCCIEVGARRHETNVLCTAGELRAHGGGVSLPLSRMFSIGSDGCFTQLVAGFGATRGVVPESRSVTSFSLGVFRTSCITFTTRDRHAYSLYIFHTAGELVLQIRGLHWGASRVDRDSRRAAFLRRFSREGRL